MINKLILAAALTVAAVAAPCVALADDAPPTPKPEVHHHWRHHHHWHHWHHWHHHRWRHHHLHPEATPPAANKT
jgi:Spy/CpxP family protein refolding chaperone